MPLLLAIIGAILLVAGPWFAGQAAVGIVLLVGAAIWLISGVIVLCAANKARRKITRSFFD